jgi:hypothetical protein
MARNRLPLERWEAHRVLVPERLGEDRVVEAVRVTVHGPSFPQRAIEPELWVGEARAERVAVSVDQKSLRGFFRKPPPEGASVKVLYGDSLEGVLEERFVHRLIRPLPTGCED